MRLLIIDDDLTLAETLQLYFRSKHQIEADIAGSIAQGQRHIERQVYDVTLLDLNLPDGNGMDFIKLIREAQPRNQIIVITANSSIEKAVEAIRLGAFDMVAKPFAELDFLHHAVNKACEHQQLKSRLVRAESDLGEKYNFANIIGKSAAMEKIFKLIRDVAYSDATIMIQGESGTGKELIARALHFHSSRQDRELIAFNCSALTESLVESELFGHVKGAFTHAFSDKRGLFEVASHSSLFLDEIGDLSLTIQAKLLRVLQEGEIMRVGSTETKKVNVRIIAATHHNLVEMVQQQRFRADLFFRLNVINIELPPLRAHKEDIEMLAMHFIKKYNLQTNKKIQGLTQEVLEKFMGYDWPGNIRELENAIERAVVLEKGELIGVESLPTAIISSTNGAAPANRPWTTSFSTARNEHMTYKEAKHRVVASFNWTYLDSLLRLTEGNISKASYIAGIERSNFKKLIIQNGIDIKLYKALNPKTPEAPDTPEEGESQSV